MRGDYCSLAAYVSNWVSMEISANSDDVVSLAPAGSVVAAILVAAAVKRRAVFSKRDVYSELARSIESFLSSVWLIF